MNAFTLEAGKITGCVERRLVLVLASGAKSEIKAPAVEAAAPVTKTSVAPRIPDQTQARVLTSASVTQEVSPVDAVAASDSNISSPIVDGLVACAAQPDACALDQDTDFEETIALLLW